MEKEEIRKQMMGLWKENFHDSEGYIRLVFDQYFDLDNIEYEERDGRIVASLLAIPYQFGNGNYAITGAYLCGLSTQNKYRGEGIMTDLLYRIEKKMRTKGFAFMFLIPADKGLNRYYTDRGFINGFYRTYLHYTSIHDFKRDYFSTISKEEKRLFEVKKRYFDGLLVEEINDLSGLSEAKIFEELIGFIEGCQRQQKGLSLYQTYQQISTFLTETVLSGGRIMVGRNSEGEIAGLSLYTQSETELREIGRYALNYGVLCKLRESVLLLGGGRNLTVIQYGYEKSLDSTEIWNPMYSAFLPTADQVGAVGIIERTYNPNSHSEIYGMVRILSISEILKFLSRWRRDLKYSILMRQENGEEIFRFSSKNGQLEIQEVINNSNSKDGEILENAGNKNRKIVHIKDSSGYDKIVLSERDLGEILFRRPGSDRLIEEAFGLPALNGKISLLLD